MHLFGLIHKDIKPPNLLINSDGAAVLADFNVSTYTTSAPGVKVLTNREGTPEFMSPAMLALRRMGKGEVDLFYNDLWGLQKSLEVIFNTFLEDREACNENRETYPQKSTEICEEAQAIIELGWICASKAGLKIGNFSTLTVKKFSSYFHELG